MLACEAAVVTVKMAATAKANERCCKNVRWTGTVFKGARKSPRDSRDCNFKFEVAKFTSFSSLQAVVSRKQRTIANRLKMSARKFLMNKTWDGRPSVASPYKINFAINAATGDIVLQVDAPFFNDAPPPGEPGKCLKVYDYEVVEVFIAAYPNDDDAASAQYSPYLEVQIGPHGHYNLVFFLQEGDFANMDTSIELDRPPTAKINPKTGRWTAEVAIPSFFLPEPVCGDDLSITWMMNAYAMHGQGEQREYIAYSPVPGPKPNFHQLRHFCPLVLFETLETRMTIDRSNSMASEKIRQSSMAGYMTSGGGGGLGAAMGLAAGAGGGDLSNRLMADVMKSGGMKGAYAEDDEDDASSGNTYILLCVLCVLCVF